jgi:hypothetical protein
MEEEARRGGTASSVPTLSFGRRRTEAKKKKSRAKTA